MVWSDLVTFAAAANPAENSHAEEHGAPHCRLTRTIQGASLPPAQWEAPRHHQSASGRPEQEPDSIEQERLQRALRIMQKDREPAARALVARSRMPARRAGAKRQVVGVAMPEPGSKRFCSGALRAAGGVIDLESDESPGDMAVVEAVGGSSSTVAREVVGDGSVAAVAEVAGTTPVVDESLVVASGRAFTLGGAAGEGIAAAAADVAAEVADGAAEAAAVVDEPLVASERPDPLVDAVGSGSSVAVAEASGPSDRLAQATDEVSAAAAAVAVPSAPRVGQVRGSPSLAWRPAS